MATQSRQVSGGLKSGFSRTRRSSVSEDSWARFRLLFSQDQLDKLSYCFGELEQEDQIGDNQIKCDKRLFIIGERFFGEDLLCDVTLDARTQIGARSLHQQGFQTAFLDNGGEGTQIMSFEQFLNFILNYVTNAQDEHQYRGYPQTFALKVKAAMKERGAMSVADITDANPRNAAKKLNDEDDDDSAQEDEDGSRALARLSVNALKNRKSKNGEKNFGEDAIAIKTASLFKVLKDMGIDATQSGDEQKRVLRKVKEIDPEDTGYFTFNQMLALFRAMDNHCEVEERRQQILIIDETGYLERDVDNLKAIFNEYSSPGNPENQNTLTMSVAQFRALCRALNLNLTRDDTARLKNTMKDSFIAGGTEVIDFSGFCRCMKKLENEDFCGLRQVMGRKDEVDLETLDQANRQLSYFERKALSTKRYT